jgi:hypothetical protein
MKAISDSSCSEDRLKTDGPQSRKAFVSAPIETNEAHCFLCATPPFVSSVESTF